MDFPKKKSLAQIKQFWQSRAEEMELTPEEHKSNEPDMVQQLSAAQHTWPDFWTSPNKVEDVINDCLNRNEN